MANYHRAGLPVAQWPTELRAPAARLLPGYRQAMGRLLAFCRDRELGIDQHSVRGYLDWRAPQLSPVSLGNEAVALRYAFGELQIGGDWNWLAQIRLSTCHPRAVRLSRTRELMVSVPLEQWPTEFREIWSDIQPAAPMGPDRFRAIIRKGADKGVSEEARASIRNSYGQYLHHRRSNYTDDAITRSGVTDFVLGLSERGCRPRTIAAYIAGLRSAVRLAKVPGDWSWLDEAATALRQWAWAQPKLKHSRQLPRAFDVWMLGHTLFNQGRKASSHLISSAAMVRDGAMLMLLIAAPLRLANLAGLTIGGTLEVQGEVPTRYSFSSSKTKGRRAIGATLWPEVRAVLETYIHDWRPVLARGYHGDELWLTGFGRPPGPLKRSGIYRIVRARTEAAFGEPLSPHYMREVAATTLLEAHPEQPQAASDLLHHHHPEAIAEYTQRASSTVACRAVQAALMSKREKVCRELVKRGDAQSC